MFVFLESFNLWQIPQILAGLSCYFVRFAIIVFGAGIIFYGIMLVLSRGNPQAYDRAKRGLTYALLGGIIIYGVYTIILSFSAFLGVTSLPWVPFSCT